MADAKVEALIVGDLLATLETRIGTVAGMVIQAAMQNQVGVAETASGIVEELYAVVEDLDTATNTLIAQLRK